MQNRGPTKPKNLAKKETFLKIDENGAETE